MIKLVHSRVNTHAYTYVHTYVYASVPVVSGTYWKEDLRTRLILWDNRITARRTCTREGDFKLYTGNNFRYLKYIKRDSFSFSNITREPGDFCF